MATRRSREIEQRLIDHQVRLSEAREAEELRASGHRSRRAAWESRGDRRWYRGELIGMLAAAATEHELRELGLSDDVVREALLGDSLAEAWTRFRPHRFHPPPAG